MSKIFISYRRKSWGFTHRLTGELERRLDADIFVDLEGIDEDDFEHAILNHLTNSDVMLLIVSEHTFIDRIHRDDDWVRREIREALNQNIPIVLVAVDGLLPPAGLPDDIKAIARKQGIPFYPDYFSAACDKLADFIVSIGAAQRLQKTPTTDPYAIPDRHPIEGRQTLDEAVDLLDKQDYAKAIFLLEALQKKGFTSRFVNLDEIIFQAQELQSKAEHMRMAMVELDEISKITGHPVEPVAPRRLPVKPWMGAIGLVAFIAIAVLLLNPFKSDDGKNNSASLTHTPSVTVASSPATLVASATDVPLNATEIEATIQSEMVAIQTQARQAELDAETATVIAAFGISQATVDALTQIAAAWTPTPSPNIRVTAQARLDATATQNSLNDGATHTHQARDMTATATLWTATPTSTFTTTPTPTQTPTNTRTLTPTLTPTLSPLVENIAVQGVGRNADWQPYVQEFDNVEMVLVPAGCFEMGSTTGESDEQPVTTICFDEPFWLDRYEATNGQFEQFNGQAASSSNWTEDNLPRENITWFEARDFCETRGARLPTEAEWEYATRGPDNLVYPWGNQFVADNVVYSDNSGGQTTQVGSRTGGVSWVGAYDLSGNVWEWVSSIYKAYPYDGGDGREFMAVANSNRVLRGGSWSSPGFDLTSANRSWVNPNYWFNFTAGFRCARSQ